MRLLDGGFSQSRKRGRKKRERDLTRQEYLDSIATSTAFIPGLGDIAEFGSLANREYEGVDKPAWWEYALATVPGGLGAAAGLIPKRTGRLADDTMPEKITAYHGSPHDFDKFKMSQIGTGEGAQAYGHGLYFAESEDVARGYRDDLTRAAGGFKADGRALTDESASLAYRMLGDSEEITATADDVRKALNDWSVSVYGRSIDDPEIALDVERMLEASDELVGAKITRNKGSMYQVEIDASPDELLDWDKPLSDQSEKVRKAIVDRQRNETFNVVTKGGLVDPSDTDTIEMLFQNHMEKNFNDATGKDIYSRLGGDSHYGQDPSSIFREMGIKGIRYKDGFSRDKEGGTSNYVIFDENIISIAKKYGLAIPAAAALYGNMTGQDASSLYSAEAVGRLGEANET